MLLWLPERIDITEGQLSCCYGYLIGLMLQKVTAGKGSCLVDVMFMEMFTGYSKKFVMICQICQIVIPKTRKTYLCYFI